MELGLGVFAEPDTTLDDAHALIAALRDHISMVHHYGEVGATAASGVCCTCVRQLTECRCKHTRDAKRLLRAINGGQEYADDRKARWLYSVLILVRNISPRIGTYPRMPKTRDIPTCAKEELGVAVIASLAVLHWMDESLYKARGWLIELLYTRLGLKLQMRIGGVQGGGGAFAINGWFTEASVCGIAIRHRNFGLLHQLLDVIPGDLGVSFHINCPTLLVNAMQWGAGPDTISRLLPRMTEQALNDGAGIPQRGSIVGEEKSALFSVLQFINNTHGVPHLIQNLELLLAAAESDGSGLDIVGQEERAAACWATYPCAAELPVVARMLRDAATRVHTYRSSLVPAIRAVLRDVLKPNGLVLLIGEYLLPRFEERNRPRSGGAAGAGAGAVVAAAAAAAAARGVVASIASTITAVVDLFITLGQPSPPPSP